MVEANRGKVLIVGGGIAGMSAAWALARRGFKVEIFEQGQIPNPRGSSYDEHRITRHHYGESKGYARLMPAAFKAFDALYADIGARPFDPLPLVALMREDTPFFEASLESLEELGIAYQRLAVEEIARRYPMIETSGLTAGFEAGGAGVLFPTRILIALAVHLTGRGVRFHPSTLVTAVDPERGTVTVGDTVHGGDVVIVAAGAWIDRLVPDFKGMAVPSRQTAFYLAPPLDLAAAWAKAPIFIDLGMATRSYTIPPRPGTRLRIGDHLFTRTGDPDDDRVATEEDIARLMGAARAAYRGFERYTMLERKACFYTVTEDEGFIIKPIGAKGYGLSACSGHGFKFGPLMGEGLARVVAGERPAEGLEAWAAGRAPAL
jgi:sarcosine oxidase/sarcosine oxidase subunit beta